MCLAARYLWKVIPSSIVPYIVTLPLPDAEPPCAQAPSNTMDATSANTIFMTAFPAKTGVDSSLARQARAEAQSRMRRRRVFVAAAIHGSR